MSGIFSSVGSYILPKLYNTVNTASTAGAGSNLYNNSTKYPGSSATPWLPGSGTGNQPGGSSGTYIGGVFTPAPTTTPTTTTKSTYSAPTTQYQQQTTYPPVPKPEYDLPEVPTLSWEDALKRAEQMYRPGYESSVLQRNKMASDQRERLAQMMAARGYSNPRGGKMEAGEGNITQDQAMALENLANDYESNKMQAANAIYENHAGTAQAMMNTLLQRQNAENASKMQQWQTEYSAALQKDLRDRDNQSNQYNRYLDFFIKLLTGDDG